MDFVAFLQEEFHEERAVLARGAGDKSGLCHRAANPSSALYRIGKHAREFCETYLSALTRPFMFSKTRVSTNREAPAMSSSSDALGAEIVAYVPSAVSIFARKMATSNCRARSMNAYRMDCKPA